MKDIEIKNGDAFELIKKVESNFVDLVLTDPPYFFDKLDDTWKEEDINYKTSNQRVKSLPAGMKFDPKQGKRVYEFIYEISKEIFRVLKPGAFYFCFSSARLQHRVASAIEDAGFYIRDTFLWIYKESQLKASSLERYVTDDKKNLLSGWKTPQVRTNYEPIIVAQKPPKETLVKNFINYQVGLFNFEEKLENNYTLSNILLTEEIEGFPNMFLVPKPKKTEKMNYNNHPTVKPISLLSLLIRMSTKENALVLDPFLGSGSTAISACLTNRKFLGFELNKEYVDIANRRLVDMCEKVLDK